MRQSHLILSNAAITWVTKILQLIPQLILVPYLIGTIGEAGYGVYALIWSLTLSVDLLEMSLQSGVVKFSAGFLAQGRLGEVNRVVSSSFMYSIVLAVVACFGMIAAGEFYQDSSGQIGPAMGMMGVLVLLVIPLTPYIAVIQSRQRYYVGAIAATVSSYATLLVVVIWFHLAEPSVRVLIFIVAAMFFLARLAQVPLAYRLVPGLMIRPSLSTRKHFKQIVSFGGAMVMVSLCITVNSTGIRWLMDYLVSTRFVAHLAIMLMPAALLTQLVGAMATTAMPATSAYQATGNQRMLQELLIRGMRYSVILVLGSVLAASLLMRNVLGVWVGPEYMFLVSFTLTLFAAQSFLQSTSICHHMLKGMGKLRVIVVIYFMGRVVVPIGLILAISQIWHEPYFAVTGGLGVGYLVVGILNVKSCARAVHADLRNLFMRAYVQPLAVAAGVGIIVLGLVSPVGMDGLIPRGMVSLLAVGLFYGGCYFFIATESERRQTGEMIRWAKEKIASLYITPDPRSEQR